MSDLFEMKRVSDWHERNLYSIEPRTREGCPVTVKGGDGKPKDLWINCNKTIKHSFWIQHISDNKYKIGFEDCLLNWRSDRKRAQLRCGANKEDQHFTISHFSPAVGKPSCQTNNYRY